AGSEPCSARGRPGFPEHGGSTASFRDNSERPMTPEKVPPPRSSARDAGDHRLLDLRLRRPPQVISREVGEWLMLIDVVTGFTYEANWLGAQVWRLLVEGRSVDDACAEVAQSHHRPREAIEKDVVAFVRDLLGYGLASAESAPAREAPAADR